MNAWRNAGEGVPRGHDGNGGWMVEAVRSIKTILAVHQGFELYGSDRVFIQALLTLRALYPLAEIDVRIPRNGPLEAVLVQHGFKVGIENMWVLRKSAGLSMLARAARLPWRLLQSWRAARRFDLVYINTCVIADYILAARFSTARTILHVHEIPTGMAATILKPMVKWSRASIVYNSAATRDAFALAPGVPSVVVLNGYDGPLAIEAPSYDGRRPMRILMIGRLNAWKGQDLLVEALALLSREHRSRLEVRVVGDTFGGQPFDAALRAKITAAGLDAQMRLEPFQPDPSPAFAWSDVVVVPSRKPEPFGLVAIEAMAWGSAPIAARHGGLLEIVEEDVTGIMFEPNDPADLAARLRAYLDDPALLVRHAVNARHAYERRFTDAAFGQCFARAVAQFAA